MASLALVTDLALHFPAAIPDLLHGLLYAPLRRAGFLRLVSDLVVLTTCHALAILTSSTCTHLLSPLQGNSRPEFEFRIVLSWESIVLGLALLDDHGVSLAMAGDVRNLALALCFLSASMASRDQLPPIPQPSQVGRETLRFFLEPGGLVSIGILGVFFLAFALLMLALTGKL